MDMEEKQKCLQDLLEVARKQPDLPWWVMDLLRLVDSLVLDTYNIHGFCNELEEVQIAQEKAINCMKVQYSEVLYKLKSGD